MKVYEWYCIFECECVGCDECCVFIEVVVGNDCWCWVVCLLLCVVVCVCCGQYYGLCVGGQVQFFGWVFGDQFVEILIECIGCFLECFVYDGQIGECVEYVDCL